MCHTTRAVGLKEKENYFSIFSNYLEVSHDASGRTDTIKMKENPFLFFYILIFMIFKYVCFPFFFLKIIIIIIIILINK